MDQHTVDLVVAADAFTPLHALFDGNGVGSLAVRADHLVHVVVDETESRGVHDGGHVDAVRLQRLEQVR